MSKILPVIICFLVFGSIGFSQPHFSSLDVFELEWITSPQISPDGEWIVYQRRGMNIMSDSKTSQLWYISSTVQWN